MYSIDNNTSLKVGVWQRYELIEVFDEEIRHGNDTREEHDNGNENAKETEQAPKIKNPPTKRKTGERNTRKKSTVEKECNKAHGRKKRQQTLELKKSAAQPG